MEIDMKWEWHSCHPGWDFVERYADRAIRNWGALGRSIALVLGLVLAAGMFTAVLAGSVWLLVWLVPARTGIADIVSGAGGGAYAVWAGVRHLRRRRDSAGG
jgi:hypothetical protein